MVESCTEGGGEIRYGATPLSRRTELLAELRAELHAELHAELVPFYLQVAITMCTVYVMLGLFPGS